MISYIQGLCLSLTRILAKINVKVYMQLTNSLRSILFYTKDSVPDDEKSNAIYKVSCGDSDVDQTGRALKTWVAEHKTAVKTEDLSGSALAQHM